MPRHAVDEPQGIPAGRALLAGELRVPHAARGLVLFAHGSGSGRHSPRNRQVAAVLRERGVGTLLLDLLTEEEAHAEAHGARLRFDVVLLADRLAAATDWAREQEPAWGLPVGYFGASTGAAAALLAAAERPHAVHAVVSRGGRPDLAGAALVHVTAPTLLIVGGADAEVVQLNREAERLLAGPRRLTVVPGATHLFEEPGALETVARLAGDWFSEYLGAAVVDQRAAW